MPGAKSAQVLRIYHHANHRAWGWREAPRVSRLGSLVQMVFPIFLERYFQLDGMPRFDPVSALQGLLVGVLTVLLFTIPPLLGIRYIRPALIFRREMAAPREGFADWWKRAAASLISGVLILVFVGALAAWLSDNARTGRYFAMAVAVGMGALARSPGCCCAVFAW